MELPNAQYADSQAYRFGFNGKENDREWGTASLTQDYGFRLYNPAIAKFLSVDPLSPEYPWYTPYQFAGNKPINSIDLDGLEEYENYEAYALEKGKKALKKMDGSDGAWLVSDRINNSNVWKKANQFNLKQKDGHLRYKTISQRADFYGWFQKETEAKGFDTKWAGAAYIVAQQMSLMDNPLVALFTDEKIIAFANEGNKAIFNDIFPKLNDLISKPNPLKGKDALDWDEQTLKHEQKNVVDPIYKKQTRETIKQLQQLAEGKGFKSSLAYMFDQSFPVGGPLAFTGNIKKWDDRFKHGMKVVIPFYEKYGSLFNWNKLGDKRMDTFLDPDNKGLPPRPGIPKY